MKKLKIHTIYYQEILNSINIDLNSIDIKEYLSKGREDILENFDIFYENVRSKNKINKNFDLFEVSNIITDDCIIILGLYLELLEFWNQRHQIYNVIKIYCNKFPNNKIVVTWNHDIDSSIIFNFMNEFNNLYVLNFNTSIDHERYIILPFWTIDDNDINEEKTILANLVCSYNNQCRINLYNCLFNELDIFISEKIDFHEYKKILSSSKFTLCPRGSGLSSYRFFECFNFNTIPVLFADDIILPFEKDLNYSDFILKIPENKSNDKNYILDTINNADYNTMIKELNNVKEIFSLKGIQEEVRKRLI
jgi:hypothetical protein